MQRAYDYLKQCRTYFLATMDGDQPRVRPFGSLFSYEGRLYFATVKTKNVYRQLKADPKIEISAMGQGGWIRVTAEAVEDESEEGRRAIARLAAELTGRGSGEPDENMAAFYLQNALASIIAFGAVPENFTF